MELEAKVFESQTVKLTKFSYRGESGRFDITEVLGMHTPECDDDGKVTVTFRLAWFRGSPDDVLYRPGFGGRVVYTEISGLPKKGLSADDEKRMREVVKKKFDEVGG